MSFIRRKFIHGNWYLYLVHSERHNGKVIQIIDEYLGPEEPKRIGENEEKYYLARQKSVSEQERRKRLQNVK
jgi:hypothetical protein